MVFEDVIVTRLGSTRWTMPCPCSRTWPADAWRKSYASEENRARGAERPWPTPPGPPQPPCRRECLWLEASGTAWVEDSPSIIGCFCLSALKLCQNCKIFLMTGHIWHLDSLVANSQPFPVSSGWEDRDRVQGAVSAAESPIWHSRHSGQMLRCWEERRRETTQELGWCQVLS